MILVENTLYDDQSEKNVLIQDRNKVIDAFIFNYVGFLSLIAVSPKNKSIRQWRNTEGKLRLQNITDDNEDVTVSVKLLVDAGIIPANKTIPFTKLLVLIKTNKVDKLDSQRVRDMLNVIKINTTNKGSPKTVQVMSKFMDGELDIKMLGFELYKISKTLKDVSMSFRRMYRDGQYGSYYKLIFDREKKVVDSKVPISSNQKGVADVDKSGVAVPTKKVITQDIKKVKTLKDYDINDITEQFVRDNFNYNKKEFNKDIVEKYEDMKNVSLEVRQKIFEHLLVTGDRKHYDYYHSYLFVGKTLIVTLELLSKLLKSNKNHHLDILDDLSEYTPNYYANASLKQSEILTFLESHDLTFDDAYGVRSVLRKYFKFDTDNADIIPKITDLNTLMFIYDVMYYYFNSNKNEPFKISLLETLKRNGYIKNYYGEYVLMNADFKTPNSRYWVNKDMTAENFVFVHQLFSQYSSLRILVTAWNLYGHEYITEKMVVRALRYIGVLAGREINNVGDLKEFFTDTMAKNLGEDLAIGNFLDIDLPDDELYAYITRYHKDNIKDLFAYYDKHNSYINNRILSNQLYNGHLVDYAIENNSVKVITTLIVHYIDDLSEDSKKKLKNYLLVNDDIRDMISADDLIGINDERLINDKVIKHYAQNGYTKNIEIIINNPDYSKKYLEFIDSNDTINIRENHVYRIFDDAFKLKNYDFASELLKKPLVVKYANPKHILQLELAGYDTGVIDGLEKTDLIKDMFNDFESTTKMIDDDIDYATFTDAQLLRCLKALVLFTTKNTRIKQARLDKENHMEYVKDTMIEIINICKSRNINISDFKIDKSLFKMSIAKSFLTDAGVISNVKNDTIVPMVADRNLIRKALAWNNVKVDVESINLPRLKKSDTIYDIIDMVEKEVKSSNFELKKQQVTKVETTEAENIQKSKEYEEKYSNGRHGNIAMVILEEYDFTLDGQVEAFDAFVAEHTTTEIHETMFHSCGTLAASFITRYGFADVQDSSIVTGKMLGDGLYVTNALDKTLLYASDYGYSRGSGNIGYVIEMKVALGDNPEHHRSAGLGRDNIRSPEWCIKTPSKQVVFKKIYKIKTVSKQHLKNS